jgi:hypothetical protein
MRGAKYLLPMVKSHHKFMERQAQAGQGVLARNKRREAVDMGGRRERDSNESARISDIPAWNYPVGGDAGARNKGD